MSTSVRLLRRIPRQRHGLLRTVVQSRSLSSTSRLTQPATVIVPATNVGLEGYGFPRSSSTAASSAVPSDENDDDDFDTIVVVSSDGYPDQRVNLDDLREVASRKPTPLRLQDMYKYAVTGDTAQRLRNAQFLHTELPIRVAQRALDLLTFPLGLNQYEPIQDVAHIYLRYLAKLDEFPSPQTDEQESKFTDMLQDMVLDRTSIPISIARGIQMWTDEQEDDLNAEQLQEIENGLYRFFTARVGLRFLIEHHVLSSHHHGPQSQLRHDKFCPNNFLGCIQTECNPVEEAQNIAKEVERQTKHHYGICPEIEIMDYSPAGASKFTYVPHHLQYMMAELLKNSCRATVKRYLADGGKESDTLHPIRVIVANGAEDVSIKIADRGGGVPRSTMKQIWKFAHSTELEEKRTDFTTDEITGGPIRGFGLPLARIYARYFGGELTLKSMEGFGLDAYLHLPRLGDACENLPVAVSLSPGERDSMPQSRRNLNTMRRQRS